MLYIKGSKELHDSLGGHETTNDPQLASCVILEAPKHLADTKKIETDKIILVLTEIIDLGQWHQVKNFEYTSLDLLPRLVEDHLKKQKNQVCNNETVYISDDLDDDLTGESATIQAPAKPKSSEPPNEEQYTAPARKKQYTNIFSQQNNRRGHIAASFSAVGGVGKTFTCINTAGYAALEGISTVVLDLDLGYGDTEVAIGLVDRNNRERVIDRKAIVPKNGWATVSKWRGFARDLKGGLLRHNSGLYVLPCYPYAGSEIPGTEIEDLILTMAEHFDLVVIDLGVDGFSPHVRTSLNLANTVFLVGGQDEKTIAKITQFLESEQDYLDKMSLIINMTHPAGFFAPREIAKNLKFNDYSEVPLDHQGVNAAKKANKLPVQLNGSQAGAAVKELVKKHLPFGQLSCDGDKAKPMKGSSIFSGLKSIFGRGR